MKLPYPAGIAAVLAATAVAAGFVVGLAGPATVQPDPPGATLDAAFGIYNAALWTSTSVDGGSPYVLTDRQALAEQVAAAVINGYSDATLILSATDPRDGLPPSGQNISPDACLRRLADVPAGSAVTVACIYTNPSSGAAVTLVNDGWTVTAYPRN